MKILVTGHEGFIGSHMFNRLKRDGHEVFGLEPLDPKPYIYNYDWVIHMGAISSTTETNVEKIMAQNYDFSCQLLDECIFHRVNFQFASSASIYGLKREFREESPVDPRTPYAWTKYMFERYAFQQTKYLRRSVIQMFRYFNVYGTNEEHKGSQASPYTQFKKQKEETGRLKLFVNSDKYYRDFIHVNDIVNYHRRFFDVEESGLWNLGTGEVKSFYDVAKEIDAPIDYIPMPQNLKHSYQEYTCADLTKLNKTLERHNA